MTFQKYLVNINVFCLEIKIERLGRIACEIERKTTEIKFDNLSASPKYPNTVLLEI